MIDPLPEPPSTADPATFDAKADALLAALPGFVNQVNATAVAMNLNSTTDVSASSVAIGLGAKTFVVTTGKSFQPGMYLVIADELEPSTNSMFGQVENYVDDQLEMQVLAIRGSGTKASWVISQSSAGGVSAQDVQTQAPTAATTTGTAPAYVAAQTLVTTTAKVVDATIHASTLTGASTLAVNGSSAKGIKQYDSSGAKVDAVLVAGMRATFMDDGTHWILMNPLPRVAVQIGALQATTAGTSIDFTGFTADVKKFTANLDQVSTVSGANLVLRPIISGGPVATGYRGSTTVFINAGATSVTYLDTGVEILGQLGNADSYHGSVDFTLMDEATGRWAFKGIITMTNTQRSQFIAGAVTLGGAVTGLRLTTVPGVTTFDAGVFNISLELK